MRGHSTYLAARDGQMYDSLNTMKVGRYLLIVASVCLLAACAGGPSSDAPRASAGWPASALPSTASSVDASDLPASCLPLPHDDPDLEAMLPTMIAGRLLAIESYHGALMVTCVNGGTAADVAEFATAMATEGLTLDDISLAVAGRSDVNKDPPYLIFAYSIIGHPGNEWPPATGLDHPEAAAFQPAEIGGKQVLAGDAAAVDQTDHVHGFPTVWDSPTIHYLVVTDDTAWAEEALSALH
jgi:hypothetical protein